MKTCQTKDILLATAVPALALALILGAALPAPAFAASCSEVAGAVKQGSIQDDLNDGRQLVELKNMFDAIIETKNTIIKEAEKAIDFEGIMKGIEAALKKLQFEKQVDIDNAKLQHDWALPMVTEGANLSKEHIVAKATLKQLCYKVRALQTSRNLSLSQEDEMASLIAGLENMEYEVQDGMGPAYSSTSLYFRCKAGAMSKAEAPKPECSRHADKELNRDISIQSLRLSITNPQLEKPKMVSKPVKLPSGDQWTVQVPEVQDDNVNQRAYRYALYFCYNLIGPTPTPPTGKDASAPAQLSRAQQLMHCKAKRSSFIQACAERITLLQRPDCTKDPELCKESIKLCERNNKDNNLPDTFEQCKKPVSPYFAEYLSVQECFKSGHYLTAALGGRKAAEQVEDNDKCLDRYLQWQRLNMDREEKFLQAVAGIEEAKSCWAGAK